MKQLFRKKFTWIFTLALAALVVIPFAAFADDISNTVDASVDATAEVMPLTQGGANGTTKLYVVPQNGDGKNGCNLTGSTTLTVSLTSSNTLVATVSPSSITFTSCVDEAHGPILTITPLSAGSADITLSQTSNTTSGSFELATAKFTVNVAAPTTNTPPHLSVGGVTGGASYAKGSVPAAVCQVTDTEDGNSSSLATLSAITGPYAADGIGEQTASCMYTDAGGLTASASETYGIVDSSAPAITYNVVGTLGNNGWYKSNVTLTWTVTELESPNSLQKTGCVDQSITADQAATTYTCSAESAGGSAGPVSISIKRDATAPTASASASPAANANGWNNTDVTVSFSGSDGLSGIDNCSPDAVLSTEAAGQSASGTCTDLAGNVSAPATASGINIDKTAPTASANASPAANTNGWNNTDVTVSYNCTDGGSGVDTAASTLTDDLLTASGTATGTCVDKAGNSDSASYAAQIDKVAPVVTANANPPANVNGWNKTDVSVSFTGNDGAGSGIDSCDTAVVLSTEGAGQSASGTCTDKAGNVSAPAAASGINIDKTAPTASASALPAPNANGWNNTNVTVSFSGADSLSDIDSCDTAVVLSTEGAGQSASGTCTDKASNVSAPAAASGINIDKTAPTLTISGEASGTYGICAKPSRPTFASSDSLSGLDGSQGDSWTVPAGVGMYTYNAHATDKAGNTAFQTRTYTVNYAGAFGGYLQPINSDGSSRFKLGSTIPVKFQLTCGGAPISNAVAKLYVAQGDNVPDPGVDEAISTAASTTGNLFRYDSTAQQYIFNLSTKSGYMNPGATTATPFTQGTWTLKVYLDDGTYQSIKIQIVK